MKSVDSPLVTIPLPEKCGSFALTESNTRLLLALESTFAWYFFDTKQIEFIESAYLQNPGGRLNDGRVDRQGAFIVGGMKFGEPA